MGAPLPEAGANSIDRGVSDHPKWPVGLPSLRPAMWSLTPRSKGVGDPRQQRQSGGSRKEFERGTCEENLRDFSDFSFHSGPGFFDRSG